MSKFAYLDSAKILHISKYEDTAKRCVKKVVDKTTNEVIRVWNIVPTNVAAIGGYPVDGEGKPYILYSITETKHDRETPEELIKLYTQCDKYTDIAR